MSETPRMPRRALVLAATGATLAGLVAASIGPASAAPTALEAPAPAPAPAPAGNFLKLWTAEWMAGQNGFSTSQATDLARRMTLIVAMRGKFTKDIAAMKKVNPGLKVLVYRNATFGGKGYADSLYAKNRSGQRIYARQWPSTYLMNLSNPAWANEVGKSCVQLISVSKYDGCFLDVLGSGPLMGNYLSSMPVTGGKTWTHSQWINWADDITIAAKRATGGKLVMGNGLGNGRRYFSSTMSSKGLVAGNDGMEPELFVREAYSSPGSYYNETNWRQDVDMMIDVQRKGSRVLSMTKLWSKATEAQKNAWHKYALATFLMGSDGNSYFCFLRDKSSGASWGAHPYNGTNIGTPTGSYTKVSPGVYARNFTRGKVVVNVGKSATGVRLDHAARTMDGARVSGSATLAPNTAEIYQY